MSEDNNDIAPSIDDHVVDSLGEVPDRERGFSISSTIPEQLQRIQDSLVEESFAGGEAPSEDRPYQSWENNDSQVAQLMSTLGAGNAQQLVQRVLQMTNGYHQREAARSEPQRSELTVAVEEAITGELIPAKIFNTVKTDYGQTQSMFLGQDLGLFDTIHRRFPQIWDTYKEQRNLDWTESEFGFDKAQIAFETVAPAITDRLLATLAWQWEGDSSAARAIPSVMNNFISCAELQAAWGRIADNENLHAATYSEIVRLGIPNPEVVFKHVLENMEAMKRLGAVGRAMHNSYTRSHQYALGLVPNDQETYNQALMFVVALLLLERVQFVASFAVTFAIGNIPEAQAFMPIITAVQRICQDELEIHVTLDKQVLANEFQTERGKRFLAECWEEILVLIREVVDSELEWARWLLVEDSRPLAGSDGNNQLTFEDLRDWIYLAAQDVYAQFGYNSEYPIPEKVHVLSWIKEFLDISKTQYSPQEQQAPAYKTNLKLRDDAGKVFAFDF